MHCICRHFCQEQLDFGVLVLQAAGEVCRRGPEEPVVECLRMLQLSILWQAGQEARRFSTPCQAFMKCVLCARI